METKEIKITWRIVPDMTDVLCVCEPRGGGAVTVLANQRGRECLQKVFPNAQIPWEPNTCNMPRDWLHSIFLVPELARGHHALPPITGNVPLEEAAPAALTYPLAYAVQTQGVRAMTWDEQDEPQHRLHLPPQH
jgi:hypothetical protein